VYKRQVLIDTQEPRKSKVLVLEDDYMIAKELTLSLKELGASKVDTVSSIEMAISCAETTRYDLAILDVNIRGKYSLEAAKVLQDKNIPFAFATGYGNSLQKLQKVKSMAILTKPIRKRDLEQLLQQRTIKP